MPWAQDVVTSWPKSGHQDPSCLDIHSLPYPYLFQPHAGAPPATSVASITSPPLRGVVRTFHIPRRSMLHVTGELCGCRTTSSPIHPRDEDGPFPESSSLHLGDLGHVTPFLLNGPDGGPRSGRNVLLCAPRHQNEIYPGVAPDSGQISSRSRRGSGLGNGWRSRSRWNFLSSRYSPETSRCGKISPVGPSHRPSPRLERGL